MMAGAILGACTSGGSKGPQATLKPTLELRQVDGGTVAFQSGQPVPDFGRQPRARIDLDGSWHFLADTLDDQLTFADRATAQQALTLEAGPRLDPSFDETGWSLLAVPGTFTPPPQARNTGGWYRRRFTVPSTFPDHASVRFQSADYIADVWVNGKYAGYHEGGTTPFALDVGGLLRRGATNAITVRVSRPELGTRLDIVPWGLTDWWEYGGIKGDVWVEGEPDLETVRADVVPHLDGADVYLVIRNRGPRVDDARLELQVLPAEVTDSNRLDPDALSLAAAGLPPLLDRSIDLGAFFPETVRKVDSPFAVRHADLWTPARPALYVLHAAITVDGLLQDQLYDSFGLRQVQVDRSAPRLLLNGDPVAFHGVAIHDEQVGPSAPGGPPAGGPATTAEAYLSQLIQAGEVNADLVRADHNPPNPMLVMLADRLGFAVWEEIPLYHSTPETFQLAMARGIPQQMLSEMDLRDQNHPSVLFHGLANESQGQAERVAALTTLRDLDRRLDGTRLTGQAAYGYDPEDPTSQPLDVVGYTFYPGVFYDRPLDAATIRQALEQMHATYPSKPVMILEFGRWADSAADEPEQARVFQVTYGEMSRVLDDRQDGFVGGAVWWSLNDYWTERPGIEVEHFGLFRPDGSPRPVQAAVAQAYAASTAAPAPPTQRQVVSGGQAIPLGQPGRRARLGLLLLYGLGFPTALMLALLALVGSRRGGRKA